MCHRIKVWPKIRIKMPNVNSINQIRRSTQAEQSLMVIQFNCNGLSSKLSEVKFYIYRKKPDIVCFCETWIKKASPKFLGYNSIWLHRETDRGGLGILVREDISYSNKTIAHHSENNLEFQAISILTSMGMIDLVNVYNPSRNVSEGELEYVIGQLGQRFILVGDFNAHSPLWDARKRSNQTGRAIERILESQNVDILNRVDTPTYIDNRTGTTSCLDLCLISSNLSILAELERDIDLGSDHFPIQCTFGFTGVKSDIATSKRWKLQQADWKKWSRSLSSCASGTRSWTSPADANTYNAHITKRLIDAAEASIPQTSGIRSCRRATPWWDDDCDEAVEKRREAKNKLWSHPTITNLIEHRKQLATAKHKMLKKKKQSWADFASSINSNTPSTKVWSAMKSINGKQTVRNFPIGDFDATNEDKAEMFLEQYAAPPRVDVNSPQQEEIEKSADEVSWKSQDEIEPIQEFEVRKAISISKNTSPGEDRVCNKFLKKAPDNIITEITDLLNVSLFSGQVPEDWKTGITCPVPKPGKDASAIKSYRPITMLSCIGKIMERVIQRRLEYFLEANSVFPPTQSAFRKGRGTTDSLAILKHSIYSGFQEKEHTIVVYLDIEGAYDCVWHNGLIDKMKRLGISNTYVYWIKNYLRDRYMKVRVGGSLSGRRKLSRGLPQGAVISPCLFNIMLHDVPKHPDVKTIIYADDITISCSSKDINTARRTMQTYLNSFTKWLNLWKFKVNPAKCSSQVFSKARTVPNINVRISNQTIADTQCQRVLGVVFDAPKLTFYPHVEYLKEICKGRLNVIKALSSTHWGSSRQALRRVYISYIRSRIEYGCVIFNEFPKKYIQKLNVLQNSALRCILGARMTSPITSLEIEAYIMPLDLRFKYLFIKWYIKTLYGPQPRNLNEIAHEVSLLPRSTTNMSGYAQRARSIMDSLQMPCVKGEHTALICPVPPTTDMNQYVSTEVREEGDQGRPEVAVVEFRDMLESRYRGYTEIYTDGSKLNTQDTAAGMFIPHLEFTATWKLNPNHTVLGAELFAILKATEFIRTYLLGNNQKFVILTDSKASLYLIKNAYNPKYRTVVFAIQENILLSRCISLQWVRGHFGVYGNEIADRAANLGHENSRSAISRLCFEEMMINLNCNMRHLWQRVWKDKVIHLNVGKFTSDLFESPEYRPWLICGTRRIDCIVSRLRIGHIGVGSHLHRFNMREHSMCLDCETEDTVYHFLMECDNYTQIRQSLILQLQSLGVPFNIKCLLGGGQYDRIVQKKIFKLLVTFLKATNRMDTL